MASPRIAVTVLILFLPLVALGAQERNGRIDGRVVRTDGRPLPGVSVVLNETSATAITGTDGRYTFGGVPPGTYSITITLGENLEVVPGLAVSAGATVPVESKVDWSVGFSETLVVSAASRRVERVIDAPGAVTSVPEAEIARRASSAQLPKLLEFSPGVQATQSGIYDYNLNTRGFNSSLNRRVATVIDGRDPSIPFLGSQEWAAIPFPLDDIASLELVRGPSAALYGANASSGVLNLTTKAPRDSLGGALRVTFGELATASADVRWAGHLGNGWYTKVTASGRGHDDFAVSRVGTAEYAVPCAPQTTGNCLPQEAVPLGRDRDRIFVGAARLDKYFANDQILIMEGGLADLTGPIFQTAIGRIQFLDVQRPWARVALTSPRFNVLASYTGRDGGNQLALASGSTLVDVERRLQVEGQTNVSRANGRVRLVVGGSIATERIDTFSDAVGRQTALSRAVSADKEAVFGQVDWQATPALKLVGASRVDFSSLYDVQWSPKGSVVYTVAGAHSVRFTYNEAFQVPNYSEFFLEVDAAPPANLAALNALCTPFGVNCGFGPTRVVALGNEELDVETTRTWEIGYKGAIGRSAFLTVDFYRSKASDFVTDLLPQLGTPLGRINPRYGPWQAPAGLPENVAATIRTLAPPILSTASDGRTILAAASYTNFGDVSTRGVDVALNYYLPRGWRAATNYSWFDFNIEQVVPALTSLLLPNAPEHSLSAGLSYEHPRVTAAVDARWVDEFQWAVGPFQGVVPSYSTVDVNATVVLSDQVSLSLQVANLFNDRHWEAFGGDILRRRALTSLQYRW